MKIKDYLIYILFPDKCLSCGKILPVGESLCRECEEENPPMPSNKYGDRYLESVAYTFLYEGKIKKAIWNFKFCGDRYLKRNFASYMSDCFYEFYGSAGIDCMVAVPMTKKNKKERSYNQSEILARELSKRVKIPLTDGLVKTEDRKSQHEAGLSERRKIVKGLYRADTAADFKNKNVLIVDDVVTTGLTLYECAKVLKKAGASKVYGITVAAANTKPLVKYY